MSTFITDPKDAAESVDIESDFLSRLALGDTIVTCASRMSVRSGTDANPSAMLNGVPTISGTKVTQNVQAGTVGNIYTLALSVRTSLDNILINETAVVVMPTVATIPP